MSKLERVVAKLLREPPEASFDDVAKILEAFGYRKRPGRGGHPVFTKTGVRPITVPTMHGKRVKRVYVQRIIEFLDLEEWYEQQKQE